MTLSIPVTSYISQHTIIQTSWPQRLMGIAKIGKQDAVLDKGKDKKPADN